MVSFDYYYHYYYKTLLTHTSSSTITPIITTNCVNQTKVIFDESAMMTVLQPGTLSTAPLPAHPLTTSFLLFNTS